MPFNDRVLYPRAADAVLGMLAPFWQLVLGVVVIVVVIAAAGRLAGRGRSRMNTALVVTGCAVIGLVLISAIAVL